MGSAQAPGENPQRVLELEEQITDLRERLEEEQRDKEGLRRLVYAHEDHIQTLKRMLPPAPQDRAQEFMQHPAQSVQTPMHASSKDVKAPRRRWFRREQGSGQ